MRIAPLALSILLCALPVSLPAQAVEPPANPALSFEERAVVVSGLPPLGRVAWFSVARELEEDWATIVRREEVEDDADGDGVVRLELGRAVPLQSVWVAIDLTRGAYAVAAPEGFALRVAELPLPGHGGEGPDYLEIDRSDVEVFVARPGAGAWGTSAGDGGAGDDGSPRDHRITTYLPGLRGVQDNGAALERLRPRDLVIVVDPNRLDVAVGRMTEEPAEAPIP